MGSRVACRVAFGGGALLAGILALASCSSEGSRLRSIQVTPANASVASGFALQLSAIGTYTNGKTRDLTGVVTWGSPDVALVALSNASGSQGLASALATGVALVEAVHPKSGVRGSTALFVTAPLLTAIEVTPAAPSIALGTSVQLTAMGLYSDGTTQDLTAAVVWSSSDPAVASLSGVPGSEGLAGGVAVGAVAIEALDSASGIVGATSLSVTPAVLTALEVTPAASSIALGTSVQLTAMGVYSDGTTQDLSGSASWDSSDPAVASVSGTGLAASQSTGVTTISATDLSTGISGSTALSVTPAVLTALEVTPTAPSIALGTGVQLTAMGVFSDGTTQDLSGSASWDSSDPAVASVSGAGLAASQSTGVTTISATDLSTGISGSTALSVTPAVLTSLEVTPTAPSIALGTGLQFTAMGVYSDGTTQDLTSSADWDSSDPTVALVSGAGLAASQSTGVTTISATDLSTGISGSTVLSVTPAVLTALEVTPAAPSIALGTSLQFTAMGIYSDGTTQDLSGSAGWDSSDPAVASVSGAGLVASLSQGVTTISATDLSTGISGSTALTVTAAVLTGIDLAPSAPSIALGTELSFSALGTFSDGTTQDLTAALTWSSSDRAVASVSNAPGSEGLATSAAVGSTAITALDPGSGQSGAEPLTVTSAALVAIDVAPVDPSIALGTDQAFGATGTYTDGSTQDLTAAVTWSSSAPAVAALSNAMGSEGLATSLAVGVTLVSALDPASGISGSTTLSVTAAVLVSIAVTPASSGLLIAATQAFTATGDYSDGSQQDLTDAVLWSSSSPAVASVSNAPGSEGLATALAAGATTITASDAGSSIDGSATLTVAADIALRAASSAASGSGVATLTIATPAGTQPGDVLVAAVCVRPSSAVITPPASAWTLVRRVDNASGNPSSLAVYTRVAAIGEPANHTWTLSTSTGSAGGIAAFSGADTAAPVDVENGAPTASGLTHATPSVTTTQPRTMLVTAHAFTSSETWTPPAGMSEAVDVASMAVSNAAGISLELTYGLQAAPGATGTKAAVASANVDTGNAHILALAPGG